MPKKIAKKMMGNTSPLANASTGLVGTMARSVFIIEGRVNSFPAASCATASLKPAPGLKRLVKINLLLLQILW